MIPAAIVTQARTTSTRLPGKVLERVGGRTLLDLHLDRLERAGVPVVVATTTNATDAVIVELAAARGVPVHRGSEHDVLARFVGAIREHDLGAVVRVTSDCPLIDGDLVGAAIRRFLDADDEWLYLSNTLRRTYPRGLDLEVFDGRRLLEIADLDLAESDREHVTPYLNRNASGRMHLQHLERDDPRPDYRITVDTDDDLTLVRRLVEEHGAATGSADEIIAVLDAHPELVALNAHVEQKKV